MQYIKFQILEDNGKDISKVQKKPRSLAVKPQQMINNQWMLWCSLDMVSLEGPFYFCQAHKQRNLRSNVCRHSLFSSGKYTDGLFIPEATA